MHYTYGSRGPPSCFSDFDDVPFWVAHLVPHLPQTDEADLSELETNQWTGWREPRWIGDRFETPYHHTLVEIRTAGAVESRSIRPQDLAPETDLEQLLWRPMPWAIASGRRWRDYEKLEPDSIFEGIDDHLFAMNNLICEQIFEGGGLTHHGCMEWIKLLIRREQWCNSRGISHRMLVVPDHHTLYPDKVPGRPSLAADRPIMRLLRAIVDPAVRAKIIYPLEVLQQGRAKLEVSYPHDVHFTRFGGFLCYRELMRTLPHCTPERVVREEDLVERTMLIAGDVAHAFGRPARRIQWFDPPAVKITTVVKSASMTDSQVDVLESEGTILPSLVVYRSSNIAQLFPFLMRHFSRLTAVGGRRWHYDLLESEAPQVVITELPERYLALRKSRWPGDSDRCCQRIGFVVLRTDCQNNATLR
jgi:SGNH hydrolase-like domain, acetyltransferase AlgX